MLGTTGLKNNIDTQDLDILTDIGKENTSVLFLAVTLHPQD